MKTLSLKQPFAELILMGRKTIELRKWNTKFRGEFLIHASKVPDSVSMKKFGFADLPVGGIVGKACLRDVKKYGSEEEFEEDKDGHLASSDWGQYGFILDDVRRVEKIDVNGMLGFWNYEGEVKLKRAS
ncbi:MAG: ASCH domain-containing protein [Nanoarchaeota archaeon]